MTTLFWVHSLWIGRLKSQVIRFSWDSSKVLYLFICIPKIPDFSAYLTTRPNVGATFVRMRNLSVFCGGTENRRHYLSSLCSKNIKHWKSIVNRHEKMCSKQWAQIRTRHVFIFNIEKKIIWKTLPKKDRNTSNK